MSKRSRRMRRDERAKAPALSDVFAQNGSPGGSLFFFGGPVGRRQPRRGTRELLQSYVDTPWMRAVVGRVSYAVASTPWRLFRAQGTPQSRMRARLYRGMGDVERRGNLRKDMTASGELEQVAAHPILDLIERGGPRLSGRALRQATQAQIDTAGEGFLFLDEFTPQRPPSTWVNVPPHLVCTIPGPFDERPMFEVQTEKGARENFPAERVLWLRDPNPAEPYGRGSGIGRALADEIDTDEAAATYVRSKLQNGGVPNAVLHIEGAQPDAAAAFQERFNAQFSGSRNAGRVQVTGGPKAMQLHLLDYSPTDLKLNELREAERNLIFQVFGIPPEILGLVENSNRATIEGSHLIFTLWCVVPRLEMWRDVLQTQLVPLFDASGTLLIDFDSPVDEDRERQVRVAQSAPHAFRVDEVRALADHPPLEDGMGERFVAPLGNVASSEPAGELDADPFGSLAPPPDDTDPAEDEGEDEKGARRIGSRSKDLSQHDIDLILRSIEDDTLRSALTSLQHQAVVAFGQQLLAGAGVNIQFSASPRVLEFLRDFSSNRISAINETTRSQIRSALERGTSAGESIDDLARRIGRVFDSGITSRSRAIARTEVVRASGFGAIEGMAQGNIPRKQWLSARDSRVRDTHAPGGGLDGQVVRADSPFTSPSGQTAQHPGGFDDPAESVNCRCVVLGIQGDEDLAAMQGEAVRTIAWKRADVSLRYHEGRMVMAARRAFRKQRAAVLEHLGRIEG